MSHQTYISAILIRNLCLIYFRKTQCVVSSIPMNARPHNTLRDVKYSKSIASMKSNVTSCMILRLSLITWRLQMCSIVATLGSHKISIARKRKFEENLSNTDIRTDDLTRAQIDDRPMELRSCERIFAFTWEVKQRVASNLYKIK